MSTTSQACRAAVIALTTTLILSGRASADTAPGSHSTFDTTAQQPGDAAAMPAPAEDQDTGVTESSHSISEIVVTAQKFSQPADKVPISLVVLSADQLQRRAIQSTEDLQFAVPGLSVQGGGTQRRINLRGVGNVFGNGAVVGEYLDEADITSASASATFGYGELDARPYDLERVEVLRGPQGTLFGVSAMGGVIRFITQKPVLDRFQMDEDVTASFTQGGAPGQRLEAMINTPLVTDKLGLRVAGEFDRAGGWIDEPVASLKDINSQNLVDVRIESTYRPTSRLNIYAMQIIHRDTHGLTQSEDADGNYTPPWGLTLVPNGEENYELSNLTASYDFGSVKLLNSATYYNRAVTAKNWGYFNWDIGGAAELDPYDYFPQESATDELRLSHADQGRWQWTVGGIYKRFRDSDEYDHPGTYFGSADTPMTDPDNGPFPYAQSDRSDSWSVFGDTSYKLLDALQVGAGVRSFRDRESSINSYAPNQTATFSSTDPRVYARYQITPDINTYVSAAKGFRPGGFNSFGLSAYQPESLWSYELGTKMRLLNHRLAVDADVFDSNYNNYIVLGTTIAPDGAPANTYSNAGTVRIKGLEGDADWLLGDDWELSFNGEVLSSKFVKIAVAGSQYQVGQSIDLVPAYSLTGSVQRDLHLAGRSEYVRLDFSTVGRQRYTPVCSPCIAPYGPVNYSDVIHMLNFNSGITWSDNLKFGIFAQNLLNDRGNLSPFAVEGNSSRSRPRTYGFEVDARFN
jgi:iron complex outermembrane recepter protein